MRTIAMVLAAFVLSAAVLPCRAEEGAKQPVFLLCPHKEKLSAWALYFQVDPKDPSKVQALVLDQLLKVNSKDSNYDAVVAAAKDPKTPRKEIGRLAASEFGKGQIHVEKDDALKTSVTPLGDNKYRLMVSLRIAADQRFNIGGKDQEKRDVVISYDAGSKSWKATVNALKDHEGNVVADAKGKEITGVAFPVTGTGIYQVVAGINGMDSVMVLDRAP
ncbi:MAG TPA: hypothetical protein VEJ63_21515 [Planctomycetota bacterium]|nr:hypothetical protein [Planctomycetota bacterium]